MSMQRVLFAGVIAVFVASCGSDGSGPAPVYTVTVSPPSASIKVGEELQLNAELEDANGNPLTLRQVTWSSTNEDVASVSPTGEVMGVSPGGPVTIRATSEGRTDGSEITVVLPPVLCTEANFQPIAFGQTVNGSLSNTDCQFDFDNSYFDLWVFTMVADANIDILMRSTAFDAFVLLALESGEVIGFDDDSGVGPQGTDARLAGLLPAGTYVIIANSFGGNLTGAYTLALTQTLAKAGVELRKVPSKKTAPATWRGLIRR